MKTLRTLEKRVAEYNTLSNNVDDFELELELFKDGEVSEERLTESFQTAVKSIEDVEFKTTLNQPEDELNCILEINAGAGGTEACDWTQMLSRMYAMWGNSNEYKISELSRVDGDVAGIKSISYEVIGDHAFGMLKGENGVHRLVRISPFNSQGKRMTSFSSVYVHPMINDDIVIELNPSDLDWDTFRASGAGGQHVNKTESAVRVRHLPTGLVAECQQERSQHMNREKAIILLKSRIYEMELAKQLEERDKIEAQKQKNEWGSQIRSYVLDDRRVKDHRTGYQTSQTDAVLNGDLNGFIRANLMSKHVGMFNDDDE
jgi:peptide chain release factor 2